jgi:hypothetical protein
MIKQFLLNPDGSIPENVNIELLKQQGIPLVIPTPVPRQSGMIAIEQEPELIGGVLKQSWKLIDAPQQNMQE